MFRTIVILVLVSTLSQGFSLVNDNPGDYLVCNACQFVVTLVEPHLKAMENTIRTDLTTFADKACARTPDLEVFKTLCTTVKDDLIDVAVQLVEALKRQINGNVTCKALKFCPP
ncbi:hypothetical protein L3Y34_008569 [Caenorhabditis briggsae]|uniref:Saposin B-type domain-containing protein n=1 Tax=Caenorhabditis briggsae TaxID=6238 RepID=A0AAE9A326_CAEBR|nr:hypothetical protein L3Y34_008569 [Caenorhabditis briggsae]